MARPVDAENRVSIRERILDTARPVFQRKGFIAVSMTDLIRASGLSRGGFYYYYGSVAEVFRDTVNRRAHSKFSGIRQAIQAEEAFEPLLERYFLLQRQRLLEIDSSMVRALYEYLFTCRPEQAAELREALYHNVMDTVLSLMQLGARQGCLRQEDTTPLAEQLALILEGLNVLAMLHGVTEETICRQLALFRAMLARSAGQEKG